MEIKRIDPYRAVWSADGAVAVANESGGITLLVPDALALLAADIQWHRMRSPELPARPIDICWSPTGQSAYSECILACVFDSGQVAVLENSSGPAEPWSLHLLEAGTPAANFTACAWIGPRLVVGTSDGTLKSFAGSDMHAEDWLIKVPPARRIVQLFSPANHSQTIGMTLEDNSVWVHDISSGEWAGILPASRFRVFGAQFGSTPNVVIAARTDSVRVVRVSEKAEVTTRVTRFMPGHLLASGDDWAVVYTDGGVLTPSETALELPEIKGRVFAALAHPCLPLGLLILGPISGDFEYPIVSWQWAKTAFVPLPRPRTIPRITACAAQAYWMSHLILQQLPVLSPESEDRPPSVANGGDLASNLHNLFTSDWFDAHRLKWYLSAPDERGVVVAAMRTQIARLISRETPQTPLDYAVIRWYSAYLPTTSAPSKQVPQYDPVVSIKGDFVEEIFDIEADAGDTARSQTGRLWKRCALTLVPLLSLSTRVSLDHAFAAYRTAPGESAIATALLEAGRFCVYSGTQWERPRFT